MSCFNSMKPPMGNATYNNWCNWAEYKGKNGQITRKDTTKWFSNARSHVAKPIKETKYVKALNWDVLSYLPYFPDIAPSDYHLFWSMTHLFEKRFYISSYKDIKKWIDSWIASKICRSSDVKSTYYQKDGKK